MIEVICGCAVPRKLPESAVGKKFRCPGCSKIIQIVSGEQLAEGNGGGDFDAGLEITAGPDQVGTRILLGGVADVQIGKLADRQIILNATKVSRAHCKLQRVDFGPSKWKVVDNKSTNGLFVNGQRVLTEEELHDDDVISVGEFELKFTHFALAPAEEEEDLLPVATPAAAAPRAHGRSFSDLRPSGDGTAPVISGPKSAAAAAALAAEASSTVGGPECPSCQKALVRSAKFCVDCGINIKTGRPVITSQGIDENSLHEGAYQWIRWISILVPLTPMPIPIRSAAFGTRKPYTIWTIAAITIVASIIFFIAQAGTSEGEKATGTNLMLWSPHATALKIDPQKLHSIAKKLTPDERQELRDKYEQGSQKLSDDELVERAVAELIQEREATRGEFHVYQLITHAFLHDTSSIFNFIMHLSGNLVFMLVFGTRVNALIGNLATAIVYPILAVSAATAHLVLSDSGGSMVGASGAIMGLAGLYLILFPVHRVFCAMWIRLWLRFYTYFACKIFQLRGFWILLIYFGYDLLMNYVSMHFGFSEGVAHMAHIGGFTTGMILGLAILFSRLWNTRGSDVLSVTLGKYAWPLIGKPSRWNGSPQYARAVSLNYQ
ncbi:MAG TPA: rhomboid family intramembrane serine protease [Humisphaera sp.]|nr:rhomboid family intramembrane serine protease [Humisphaera sp.]